MFVNFIENKDNIKKGKINLNLDQQKCQIFALDKANKPIEIHFEPQQINTFYNNEKILFNKIDNQFAINGQEKFEEIDLLSTDNQIIQGDIETTEAQNSQIILEDEHQSSNIKTYYFLWNID